MEQSLTTVIITKNRPDELNKCIEYVLSQVIQSSLIVIDASDNVNKILEKNESIKYCHLVKDPGPIACCNLGVRLASTKFVCILDDDCYLVNDNYFYECINLLNRNKVAAVCGRVRYINGDIQFPYDKEIGEGTFVYNNFIGCSTIFNRRIFIELGGYDDIFFIYDNEPDLAMKIINKGFYILYTSKCECLHLISPKERSNNKVVFYQTRNSLALIFKNAPVKKILYSLIKELRCKFSLAYKKNSLRHYLFGILGFISILPIILIKRHSLNQGFNEVNTLCHKKKDFFIHYEN